MKLDIKQKYDSYPECAQVVFTKIRSFIFEVAKSENLGDVEETLKWGEPSYVVSGGSAIRIDWKAKYPDEISIYFNCKTSLVETFKEIFGHIFKYHGNRQMIFSIHEGIPITELKMCILASLTYYKIKNLPMLGLKSIQGNFNA